MIADDARALTEAFASASWPKPIELFEAYFREQQAGDRVVLVAEEAGGPRGYVTILWRPQTRSDDVVPEIRDLNVLPASRRKGIGTALMDEAEARVAERYPEVRLAVGLYADYGSAQRMYVKRGYIPDGRGICYKGKPVPPGDTVRNDDDLLLCMTKRLR